MRLLKIFAAVIMFFVAPSIACAEMPEISAGEMYFDVFKGCYVLKGNVHVAANNHGFKAVVTADEAQVSIVKQQCRAQGNVKLTQDNITFGCERAFLQWQTKTAEVTGAVNFDNEDSVAVTADSAVFNWQEKIVDFYGNIKLTVRDVQFADGIALDGEDYQHVQYNVAENKILALDKNFAAPEIVVPDDV